MDEPIVVGIDIGTTKVCTLVARVEGERTLRILGVGIEPSQGIRKGTIVDLASATQAISRSIEKAQRTSGLEITSALVSLAGSNIESYNSKGVVGISGRVIEMSDVNRALEQAQAVSPPHNREVIHIIQRGFSIDGQEGIRLPVGLHGYRLEVEAHVITASSAAVENLRKCVQASDVGVSQFVLNPLASGEVVLTDTEREMGVVVCDIGGGTSDMAIYINGDVWHTIVMPIGGNHITSDIAHGMSLSLSQAEEVKKLYGCANVEDVADSDVFTVRKFGEDRSSTVSRKELAEIINARVEEIFELLLLEIKRSGYDGLLPAGMVLTGGSSLLPGIRTVASNMLGIPVRIAGPENLLGLTDQLHSPAFSTSVGLLNWAILMNDATSVMRGSGGININLPKVDFEAIKTFFTRLLP
ncbi:cell division protein FtsA [Leptolinea tardivitalis]|uniref:Cell division protein FtsA n=1 Tax=Leptolinea tardivitalis TaxID=229920 RepID=A0A0P6WSE3_9CHLR|nr:cell division protein FtsA [Leptolinea tardivitalis]KPL71877.1 cell division protein FtsA [Leptolinea tardivitalis]GAP20283.1 cell division protein FtsA [Leptolinea tardivitalis]